MVMGWTTMESGNLLSSPLRVNGVTLRNRVVMPAFGLKYCGMDRQPSERLAAFYEARARGGCGLIVIGGVGIDLTGSGFMVPSIESDELIASWASLIARVKRHGAAIFLQLFHAGRYQHSMLAKGQQSVAPSAVPSRYTGETPRELTEAEILEIQEKFVQAARRAQEAGADGVELIASAGYLICQFLSPLTNLRQDRYGGSFENRCRFGVEVISKVRGVVGPAYPIGVRISGNEFMPGGNTNDEIIEICRAFEAAGADLFNVTGGWHETRVPQLPSMVPAGAFSYLARRIRRRVATPVVASNRIVTPEQAESMLADGSCDLVSIGRAQIADPDWASKATESRGNEIRPCVGCLQGCLDRLFLMQPVQCLCNPLAGFEDKRHVLQAAQPRRIVVVGAGPAGMEAALTAHRRGHDVLLLERNTEVGGQLPLVAAPPGRGEFRRLLDYYRGALAREGVPVRLGFPATLDAVQESGADSVILATGARPVRPPIPGIDFPHVLDAWDVLGGKRVSGPRVVILGGGAVGVEVALHLASVGTIDAETLKFLFRHEAESTDVLRELISRGTLDVTVVEVRRKIGEDIGHTNRWVFLKELEQHHVTLNVETRVTAVTTDGVLCERGSEAVTLPADCVVCALGVRSENGLAEPLRKAGFDVRVVGDASKPRNIMEAVHEGFLAGAAV
ncbi:MAG: FAD-dependent oxidoreductase [Deltaproteobacteria bacterium]|nr:FAD-dependent oxidoreductase [Deltaproteobacteria bacterium]